MVQFQSKPKGPRTRKDGIISSPKASTCETQEEATADVSFMIQVYVNRSEAHLFQVSPPKPPTHDLSCPFPFHCLWGQDVWKPGIEDVG